MGRVVSQSRSMGSCNPKSKPNGLSCSAARVAGEHRPLACRACGHAALPRRRTRRPGLPVSRARRDPATPAVSALVCFARAKRSRCSIRLRVPLPPLACSRRANLASKHTHMTVEAYPPDGPQISLPQGSQNFSARVVRVERLIARARVCLLPLSCLENFCAQQAGGCAVPDPGRFGEPEIRPCPHTHVVVEQSISGDTEWLTIKRQHTRQSNSLA